MKLEAAAVLWAALVLGYAAASGAWAGVLRPIDPAGFYVSPGRRATLRWKADGLAPGATPAYVIRDYAGKPVGSGQAAVADAGLVEASVQLPRGYYDVEFAALKQRFGVVSLPARRARPDPFFCIDSAMSWLVRSDEVREGLTKALRRCGIAMSRERLSWGAIHPAAGKWDWQAPQHFEQVRLLHARHGVAVLEMFHHATPWSGEVGKYPDDLVASAASWRQIARRWRPTWGALEVWNEPDIFFGGDLPADQYASLVKVFPQAFARERIDVPLVGGVLAHCNERFMDNAAANGLLECIDAFSFHTYGRALQMEDLIGRYRRWLRANGRASMPLWITECGRPWRKGPDRPPADQDAASALDITMKAVESRACGIARYFAFVYPFYEERQSNFGMVGREATPLRAMAAYAQLAAALAGKGYLGDLACDDAKLSRARLFADDKAAVAVLYDPSGRAGRSVRLPVPILAAEGIDGRKLEAPGDGTVPLADGLTYVRLDRARLAGHLRAETPAMRLWRLGREAPPKRPAASPVVLRFQFDGKALKPSAAGYRLQADPTDPLALRVRAFDLSGRERELTLRAAVSPRAGRMIKGTQRIVRVPAEGFADVEWQADLADAFAETDRAGVTFSAVGQGAPAALPLAIDLYGEATLKQRLGRYGRRVRLPVADVSRWKPNIAGHGRMTVSRTAEGHWRLTAEFGKGDPWVYPYFALGEDVSMAKFEAMVIRARCRGAADVRVFLWESDAGAGYLTPGAVVPADGTWHTATVRFADLSLSTANAPDANGRLDLAKVRRISIGLNSKGKRNTLDVSDLYVVGGK